MTTTPTTVTPTAAAATYGRPPRFAGRRQGTAAQASPCSSQHGATAERTQGLHHTGHHNTAVRLHWCTRVGSDLRTWVIDRKGGRIQKHSGCIPRLVDAGVHDSLSCRVSMTNLPNLVVEVRCACACALAAAARSSASSRSTSAIGSSLPSRTKNTTARKWYRVDGRNAVTRQQSDEPLYRDVYSRWWPGLYLVIMSMATTGDRPGYAVAAADDGSCHRSTIVDGSTSLATRVRWLVTGTEKASSP